MTISTADRQWIAQRFRKARAGVGRVKWAIRVSEHLREWGLEPISREIVRKIESGERVPGLYEALAWAEASGESLEFLLGADRVKGLYDNPELALFNQPLPLAAGF